MFLKVELVKSMNKQSTTGLKGIILGFVMSDKTCETESAQAKPKAPQTFKGALISSLKNLQTREMYLPYC